MFDFHQNVIGVFSLAFYQNINFIYLLYLFGSLTVVISGWSLQLQPPLSIIMSELVGAINIIYPIVK